MTDSNSREANFIINRYRTHSCGGLNKAAVGQEVTLTGWINSKRDHGSLLFLDLRDSYGKTQCVLRKSSEYFALAAELKDESTITVSGKVVTRAEMHRNAKLATGDVEVQINKLLVVSRAAVLPFTLDEAGDYPEEIRLTHRYLDLRREEMQQRMLLRNKIVAKTRDLMHTAGFSEFSTPILTASSPEGARDFLVPSRINPGKFYALPQAPQQFKQLIMLSGFERYFQIAPCFRDEDPRADRSPGDFYQLDVEMAFVEQEDILRTMEKISSQLFAAFDSAPAEMPYPRFTYAEAMRRYGIDKPDLRIELELVSATEIFRDSAFQAFSTAIKQGAEVIAIPVPNCSSQPRKFFTDLDSWVKTNGGAGLAYITFKADQVGGSIASKLSKEQLQQLKTLAADNKSDSLFFICGKGEPAYKLAGKVRLRLGQKLKLVKDGFYFCWITDFPMYSINEETGEVEFGHNPFTKAQCDLENLDTKNPEEILAYQYDLVCNGYELGSGAIRNHSSEALIKSFEIAGYSKEVTEKSFGALVKAFKYGAPPHGGIALGMERIIMIIAKAINLREITLFPLNQQARDLMMSAPAEVTAEQLEELSLALLVDKDAKLD